VGAREKHILAEECVREKEGRYFAGRGLCVGVDRFVGEGWWGGVGKGEFVPEEYAEGRQVFVRVYSPRPCVVYACVYMSVIAGCFRVYCLLSVFLKQESKGERTSRQWEMRMEEREREFRFGVRERKHRIGEETTSGRVVMKQ
jgi:hypothetical protein